MKTRVREEVSGNFRFNIRWEYRVSPRVQGQTAPTPTSSFFFSFFFSTFKWCFVCSPPKLVDEIKRGTKIWLLASNSAIFNCYAKKWSFFASKIVEKKKKMKNCFDWCYSTDFIGFFFRLILVIKWNRRNISLFNIWQINYVKERKKAIKVIQLIWMQNDAHKRW